MMARVVYKHVPRSLETNLCWKRRPVYVPPLLVRAPFAPQNFKYVNPRKGETAARTAENEFTLDESCEQLIRT